jgi:hypothetical protein
MPTLFDLHGIDLNEEAPQQPEKAGFLRRAVGDTGISLVKGAIGVPEAIVGVADLATGGQAGRLAEQAGFRPKEARAALDELLSPQQQAENREVQQASGFMETARAMLKNPSTNHRIFHNDNFHLNFHWRSTQLAIVLPFHRLKGIPAQRLKQHRRDKPLFCCHSPPLPPLLN